MIGLAGATLRFRWLSVFGAFVALAIGVGMISTVAIVLGATMTAAPRPPERFVDSPVVVVGQGRLVLDNGQDVESVRQDERPPVAPDLVDRLAATGRTVVDRTFYAQVPGGPAGQVGHPWAVSQLGRYELVSGRPPAAANEIVVPSGMGTEGAGVSVNTRAGPSQYTVVGVVAAVGFESAVFFSDSEAARLSPAVTAVAFLSGSAPDEATVGRIVGDGGEVLTGDDRRQAEEAARRDRQQMLNTRTLLAVAGGLAAFVAVFVVASTFAFTVAQRRAEFALLRTLGATVRQVRRLVLGEAAMVGLAGSIVGCVIGVIGGPLLGDRLARDDTAPAWFDAGPAAAPLLVSVIVGVGVAVVAARTAAAHAGRVSPIEALREARDEKVTLTRGRLIAGLVLLFCALGGMVFVNRAQPHIATVPVIYMWLLIITVTAVAVLAPALVPPFIRVVTWPLTRRRGAVGMLVRQQTLNAVRRTVGTAAPVLLTLGLALSLLGALGTTDSARIAERDNTLIADLVLLPDDAPGLSPALGERLAGPGDAYVATSVPLTVYGYDSGRLRDFDATAVDPVALEQTSPRKVLSGSMADLADDTVVVTDRIEASVGQELRLWLGTGQEVTLRVAAVVAHGIGGSEVYLAPSYAARGGGDGLAESVLVKFRPGADPSGVRERVESLAGSYQARIASRDDFACGANCGTPQSSMAGVGLLLGVTALYCGIAIVNMMMMAAASRVREYAVLRLAGATPRQVRRVVTGEALLVVGVGAALAVLATAVNLAGTAATLSRLVGGVPVAVPWVAGVALVAGSALLVLVTSLLTVRVTMRAPAVQLVGARE